MEKEQILKRHINKITASLYQALGDIDLALSTDDINTYKYFLTDIETKIQKAISEYVKEKEK